MKKIKFSLVFALLLSLSGAYFVPAADAASARVTTAAALTAAVSSAKAGDTITVAKGEYKIPFLNLKNKNGSSGAWITIKGEDGAVIKGTDGKNSIIELENSSYIRLDNLEVTAGSAADDIAGIRLSGNSASNIDMRNLYVHDVTGNGVSVFSAKASEIKLINSQIANCGDSGVYWGYQGKSVISNSEISDNYIHHSPKNAANNYHYGIQIKGGSYSVKIARNIMHDVGSNQASGLMVYYGRKALIGDASMDMNSVTNNIVWNCRNECVTVASDANVSNNMVFSGKYGFSFQSFSDETFAGKNAIENMAISDNVAMHCTVANFNFSGFESANTGSVALVGNASYQKDQTRSAFSGSIGNINSSNNLYNGKISFSRGLMFESDSSRFAEKIGAINSPDIKLYPSLAEAMASALSGLGAAPAANKEDINAIALREAQLILSQKSMASMDAAHQNVYNKLVGNGAGLSEQFKFSLSFFVYNGTDSTRKLGGGERGGVVNSYKSAFGHWPETLDDWKDVIKIANGRWPAAKSLAAETEAKKMFKKVWLREANMNQANDNAAVTVITYGLRMATRRPDSEKTAILTFKKIFGYAPTSARDWDVVRAVAYSGATR
jgi:hypothetical protein